MAEARVKIKRRVNQAAVQLGRIGGRVGGPARAKALPGSQRTRIASHAAKVRHGQKTSYTKPDYYKRHTRPYPERP